MASFLVGSFAFNMATWDLSDIADGTVTSDGATEVDVSGHSGLFVYTITGSGFTTFDTNGFPTDGTVTGVTMAVPGKAPMTIAGVSISATGFMGFVNAHDTAGLETAIFAGNDAFVGRAGNDTLLGFGGNDTFNLSKGGADTANGGDGNDVFNMGGAMTAADSIDGGTGTDKLTLNGDYSAGLTMGAATMVNVETMTMIGNHDYNVTFSAASDTLGQSLNVLASSLTAAHHVILDGSAATGSLRLAGGHGNDTLTGGAGSNVLLGGDGNDTIHGGTGDNIISGGQGINTLIFSNWTAGDDITNGALVFDGDFSAGVTIAAGQAVGVLGMSVAAGHDYNVTLSAGSTMGIVTADALGAANALTLTVEGASHQMQIDGGAGNDVILVTNGINANFNLTQGGDDTVTGSTLADAFSFGNTLTAADTVDGGGGGADILSITGNNTVVMGASTTQGIAEFDLAHSSSPPFGPITDNITENDGNVAAGQVMLLDTLQGAGDSTTFDGSAETDGKFVFTINTVQTNILTGGGGDDVFNLTGSGTLNAASVFSGGGGYDTLSVLNATVTLGAHQLVNFEEIDVRRGAVATNNNNVAAGQTMVVKVEQVGGSSAGFNGLKELDGHFSISGEGTAYGGQGDDTINLTANANRDAIFQGSGGADQMSFAQDAGGAGTTGVFIYKAAADSTSTAYDTITNFATNDQVFDLTFAVGAVNTAVTTGALSTASFDSDLAAAIGSGQLGVHDAVVFTPNSGTLAGDHFLVIDANGVAGYQAGADLVILLDTTSSLSGLSVGNFAS